MVMETPTPTEAEINLLRYEIDPLNIRRLETLSGPPGVSYYIKLLRLKSKIYRKIGSVFSSGLKCNLPIQVLPADTDHKSVRPIIDRTGCSFSQTTSSNERAQTLLDRLTPEERVGQLFLITFTGPEAGVGPATGAQIYDLIINYHVGGVILKAANDNFLGSDQTLGLPKA
jgi:hypothetical protein